MTELPFYIVDVFAEARFAGNPLAVIRNAAALSAEAMQTIAHEMNFSETTFIRTDEERDGGYDVRIFTPGEELPFAGHPTLGTAYIIQREIVDIPFEQIVLNLKGGRVPVTFTYRDGLPDVLWMRPQAPHFGPTTGAEAVAQALGLHTGDLDPRFPAQTVSTGVPFLIVPLRTLDAVKRAQAHPETYLEVAQAAGARWMLFFSPETYQQEHQLNARMIFSDRPGSFREDPATGSANSCLAAYLAYHRYFGSETIDIQVEQGYEVGRPSLLMLRTAPEGDSLRVAVGGRVFMVARGMLTV